MNQLARYVRGPLILVALQNRLRRFVKYSLNALRAFWSRVSKRLIFAVGLLFVRYTEVVFELPTKSKWRVRFSPFGGSVTRSRCIECQMEDNLRSRVSASQK